MKLVVSLKNVNISSEDSHELVQIGRDLRQFQLND